MRRNEFVTTAPMGFAAQQSAYQQRLLLDDYLRQQREMELLMLGVERRQAQPNLMAPIYPKFIYPGSGGRRALYTREPVCPSLNSLLDSEFDVDERSVLNEVGGINYGVQSGGHEQLSAPSTSQVGIDAEKVVRNLTAVGRFLEMVQSWPLPRLSFNTACICFLLAIFIAPRTCAQNLLFPAFRLSFGTLYPAYASYKAVRTKNVKEYVKWMMYWIVYAFFTCIETFTDIFLSWFPFYYEVKVVIVLWLLSPATKGSSTLYRKFVHPMLTRREQEIDEYLNQAKERGYSAVLQLGSKGVNYATNVIMQTALKGGGNLVQTIRRSYSLSDLSEPDVHRTQDEVDEVVTMRPQQRLLRPRLQTIAAGRSASGTRHSTGMYFTEVDVTSKSGGDFNYNIRSSEDISSGYSSAEPVSIGLSRTSSMTNASKARLKAKRSEEIEDKHVSRMPEVNLQEGAQEETQTYPNIILPESIINDLRDEVFMQNELYYASSTIPEEKFTKNIDTEKSAEIDQVTPEKINNLVTNSDNFVQYNRDAVFDEKADSDNKSDSDEFLDTISYDDSVTESTIDLNSSTTNVIEEFPTAEEAELKLKVRPSELRDTLKEIKENFRVVIDAPPPSSPKETEIDKKEEFIADNDNVNRRTSSMLLHNKGKAPPPPVPARPSFKSNPSANTTDTASVSSLSSTHSSQGATPPRTGIFQSIRLRTNKLRHKNDSSSDANEQRQKSEKTMSASCTTLPRSKKSEKAVTSSSSTRGAGRTKSEK